MNKPKKINLFNANDRFKDGFVKGCEDNDVELNVIRTKNTIIHLKDGEDVKFVHRNKLFEVTGAYNFFQMRGFESLVPTMIAKYCAKKGIDYNDKVNEEHTQGGLRKMVQMLLLHMANLPIPETIVTTSFSYEKNRKYILKNISFPIVLKGEGDQGKAVWKIDSLKDLDERLLISDDEKREAIKISKTNAYLLQEYIPNTHDFRVTMFQGENFGVIKRISKDGFYNNYSKGASWEVSEVTDEELELSQKACNACNIDLGGVDFVRTEDGIKFFEVNKSPMINKKYPEIIVKRLKDKYLS